MATKNAIFEARRQRLLQIESKVRRWWEEKGVSKHKAPYMKILTEVSSRPYWPWKFEFNDEMRRKSTINFPSPGEAIRAYSADATLLTIATYSADSVAARQLEATLFFKVSRLVKEIEWMEEFLQPKSDDQSSLRKTSLTTFPERVFENQINVAIQQTEKYYRMPLKFPKPCFRFLQDARELYIFLCGGGAATMNRELMLHYMDVQTLLINMFCPHYAYYVWREVLKKDDTILDARCPSAASADFKLSAATEYLHKLMRMIDEDKTITEDQRNVQKNAISSCLTYIKDEQLEHEPPSQEIKGVDNSSSLSDMRAFQFGNASSPSVLSEREVMEQNLDFIKKLCGFQDGEVLSSTQFRDFAKYFVQ